MDNRQQNTQLEIVFPVWNRPVETRSALVNLIHYTPGARYILVDYGSDRETELMLQEFADGLEEQALLIRSEKNEGFVRALNRGLERATASLVGIVRQTAVVQPGWIDLLLPFLQEHPEAGVALPSLVGSRDQEMGGEISETAELSFAAMLLKRETLLSTGLFNVELDGGFWCLQEYGHRLYAGGWRVFVAAQESVEYTAEVPLGSELRRRNLEETARNRVLESWGASLDVCVQVSCATTREEFSSQVSLLMSAARQGHRLSLHVPAKLYDELKREEILPRHVGIEMVRLPRFFPGRAASSAREAQRRRAPELLVVSLGSDSVAGGTSLSMRQFNDMIAQQEKQYYRR